MITWDGVLSLLFVVSMFSGIIGLQYMNSNAGSTMFEEIHLTSENAIETLSKSGLLEQLGVDWSNGNYSKTDDLEGGDFYGATMTAKERLDQLIPTPMGYRLMVENNTIYDTRYELNGSRPREEDSTEETRASRIVSGYSEGRPSGGWTARAWISKTDYGSTNLLSETPAGLGDTDLNLSLSGGGDGVLYLRVPLGYGVNNASIRLSWSSVSTTTTTSASTTSSPSSTTMPPCIPCPEGACTVPADDYSTQFTNYHKFTLGSTCDVTLRMIPMADSDYDLYMLLVDGPQGCKASVDGGNYDSAHCNSNSLFDGGGFVEWCVYDDMPPGTYYLRVDCYIDALNIHHCPGTYDLTLEETCT